MVAMPLNRQDSDDPRNLRDLVERVVQLAADHQVRSVIVGMSGLETDLLFPEVVDYVGSALRVEDTIFRMTRNRAIFFLADADEMQASAVMERVVREFHERFPTAQKAMVSTTYVEVVPGGEPLAVKDVLPALFAPPSDTH
jgi:hypothetical protein